jgi:hypothetical protein
MLARVFCRLMSDWKVELINESTKEFEVDFHGPAGSTTPHKQQCRPS